LIWVLFSRDLLVLR